MLGPEPVEEDTSIQHTIDVITQELYVIAEGGGSATPLFTLVLGAVIGLIVGCLSRWWLRVWRRLWRGS